MWNTSSVLCHFIGPPAAGEEAVAHLTQFFIECCVWIQKTSLRWYQRVSAELFLERPLSLGSRIWWGETTNLERIFLFLAFLCNDVKNEIYDPKHAILVAESVHLLPDNCHLWQTHVEAVRGNIVHIAPPSFIKKSFVLCRHSRLIRPRSIMGVLS